MLGKLPRDSGATAPSKPSLIPRQSSRTIQFQVSLIFIISIRTRTPANGTPAWLPDEPRRIAAGCTAISMNWCDCIRRCADAGTRKINLRRGFLTRNRTFPRVPIFFADRHFDPIIRRDGDMTSPRPDEPQQANQTNAIGFCFANFGGLPYRAASSRQGGRPRPLGR